MIKLADLSETSSSESWHSHRCDSGLAGDPFMAIPRRFIEVRAYGKAEQATFVHAMG